MTIVFHPRTIDHRQGSADHPERPERLRAIRERLEAEKLWNDVLTPSPLDLEFCARLHRPDYLQRLATLGEAWWDADTYVRPETLAIAQLAAGGAVLAARKAVQHNRPALALHRPPGHHATAGEAMGFCYLNHIALAAEALRIDGLQKIAIVDIDVHHGNGTQALFYDRPDVLFISSHQFPLWPGTGRLDERGSGAGFGFNVNIPLPPGSGDATFDALSERVFAPALRAYQPEAILISLGADAHYRDPLAQLTLSTAGFLSAITALQSLASELCDQRIMYCLEGGYDTEALADVIAGTAALIQNRDFQPRFTAVSDENGRGLAAVAAAEKIIPSRL